MVYYFSNQTNHSTFKVLLSNKTLRVQPRKRSVKKYETDKKAETY